MATQIGILCLKFANKHSLQLNDIIYIYWTFGIVKVPGTYLTVIVVFNGELELNTFACVL